VLNQLFSLFSDRVEGVSVIKLINQSYGGLLRILELYEIIPTFCTRAEVKNLFTMTTIAQVSYTFLFRIESTLTNDYSFINSET
jgi:hypothetical protein